MTTKEINQKIAELTKELNKVKSYATRLANKLNENNIEVPKTNWTDEEKENNN